MFNSISQAKRIWETSAIISNLYISLVLLECRTFLLHSELPFLSLPRNTGDALSSDAENEGTYHRHKAAVGKCIGGWDMAVRSSTPSTHSASLLMRGLGFADFHGHFHR